MIAIQISAEQFKALGELVPAVQPNQKIWLFNYGEHLDIEVEHIDSLIPSVMGRIWRDGRVEKIERYDDEDYEKS